MPKEKKSKVAISKGFKIDKEYSKWLKKIKDKVRVVQIKAAVKVNSEMLAFYWELGANIVTGLTPRNGWQEIKA